MASPRKRGNNFPRLNLRLSQKIYAWLKDYANEQGQSMSAIVKDCLVDLKNQVNNGNCRSMKPLSKKQIKQYDQDGYLLVSGLIPEEIALKAEAAMWRCVGIKPDSSPSSWENIKGGIRLYNSVDLVNCYTPRCLAVAAQLTEDDPSTFSQLHRHPKTYCAPDFLAAQAAGEDVSRFFRWDCAYTINVFPTSSEWKCPTISSGAHIDHSLEAHHHQTFPPVFRIGVLIYLNHVDRHGGGTFVWPGSHRRLETLARQNPKRYEYRSALTADISKIDLGDPVELTARRGDVLFLQHLCVHSGSMNLSRRPRFALNMKW